MFLQSASRLIAVTLALSLALSGCIMQGEAVPDTQFFVLGALPAGTSAVDGVPSAKPLVVDLATVGLPQYLQRAQIVTRVDANRLLFSDFEQWGGNLEKNVSRALAANFAQLLGTSEVHIAARRTPAGVDVQVEVEVMQFERGPDGRVVLVAHWRVLDGAQGQTLVSQITTLHSEPQSAVNTMAATVAAMSDLLAQLSRQIATAIVKHRGTS